MGFEFSHSLVGAEKAAFCFACASLEESPKAWGGKRDGERPAVDSFV